MSEIYIPFSRDDEPSSTNLVNEVLEDVPVHAPLDLQNGQPTLRTFTGKLWHLLEPRAEDVCIEDIAHALSLTCRWAGHTAVFTSVGQHSIMVAMMAAEVSSAFALKGLLHDASEAYLLDVPTPLKKSPAFKEYYALERKTMEAISTALKVDLLDLPEAVHKADKEVGLMENAFLCPHPHKDNPYLDENGNSKVQWKLEPPHVVEQAFLHIYHELKKADAPRIIIP